jgi:hypothetical protein
MRAGHHVRLLLFMDQTITHAEDPAGVALGRWLGRRDAFAAVAGRCTAAEAQSLQQIRETRAYKEVEPNWEEFCARHVGVSRRQVDRTIRLLEEFGPAFFHVAQMAHVTPDEYRAIAAHVGEDGVRVDGTVIALLPENSEKVSCAVAELVKRHKPAALPGEPQLLAVETVLKKLEALRLALAGMKMPDAREQSRLLYEATALAHALDWKDVHLPEW